jgi:hypothetical protein
MTWTCLHCDEPVTGDDIVAGASTHQPLMKADGTCDFRGLHRECEGRMVFGSVGHQLGRCSCRGCDGTMEDPPGMTKREAARAAVDLARRRAVGGT